MNIFEDLSQQKDELYDWKESMHRSRSLTCLDPKVDIITSIFLAEKIIHRILKQSTPSEVKNWNWLDPVAGRGTFGYILFYVLYDYLKEEIEDNDERRKHILSRIYLAEINKGLCNNLKKDFIHVYHVDSLDFDFNNMKFDVVIGNPPYQPPLKKENGKGNGSRNKIWHKFVELGFNILNDSGYIAMITPNNWRAGNFTNGVHKKAQQLMWANKIIYVSDVKKYFNNVGYSINIDTWVIKKETEGKHEINLPEEYSNFMLIPKSENIVVRNYFKALYEETEFIYLNVNLHDRRKYSYIIKSSKGDSKHPYCHVNSYSQFINNQFDWYNLETDNMRSKKVIIFDSGNIGPIYDKYGRYGTGSGAYAYTVRNDHEAEMIINLFSSNIYKTIKSQFTQENALRNPTPLFRKLPLKWLKENFDES